MPRPIFANSMQDGVPATAIEQSVRWKKKAVLSCKSRCECYSASSSGLFEGCVCETSLV